MSGSVVNSFGGSFFSWFQDEVLPYLIATVDILIIIICFILNILLIVTLKKRKLFSLPSNGLVFQLVLVDLICCVVVLIPGTVVAFLKFWPLTNIGCSIHAIAGNWLYLLTFCFLSILMIERTVKQTNLERYDKTFASTRFVVGISLVVWGFCLVVAVVPVTRWGTIAYDFYHAACIVYHTENIYYLTIIFVLGIGLSIMVVVISLILIYREKREYLKQKPVKNDQKVKNNPKPNSNPVTGPKSVWGVKSSNVNTTGGTGSKPTATGGNKLANSKLKSLAGVRKMKMAMTRMKVLNTFDKIKEIEKDPDFHLTVTYLIVWSVVTFCWIPYFVASYVDSINQNEKMWRGAYTITIIVANVSYCIKPIIYLAHNRHYRENITSTIPENVKAKATAVKASISTFADKLDKVLFKSTSAGKKLNATLTAKLIGRRWLNKVRMKKKLRLQGIGTSTASTSNVTQQSGPNAPKTTNNSVALTLTSLETVDENKYNVIRQDHKKILVKEESKNSVVKEENRNTVIKQEVRNSEPKQEVRNGVAKPEVSYSVGKKDVRNSVAKQEVGYSVAKQEVSNSVGKQDVRNSVAKHEVGYSIAKQEGRNYVAKQEIPNQTKDIPERNNSVFNRQSYDVTPRDVNVVSKDVASPNKQPLSRSNNDRIELTYVNGNVDLAFI
ncbi:hypothetical protein KUTeg_015063 [Tegillarca granosa]|uniref:G-protein coupled receptors family 1 profile domain-containing protein n=1 Tax=Tegillarca granosa TaxID=220873 RepID=A0ABQ9EP09_TEGGR|nr:hypothetical protein KUTeg_015063 [Tegillarca granosa]